MAVAANQIYAVPRTCQVLPDSAGKKLAFSTKCKQMSTTVAEGLIVSNGLVQDHRQYIDYAQPENNVSSLYGLVQIEGTRPGNDRFVGSGVLLTRGSGSFVLTCAHNVLSTSDLLQSSSLYPDLTAYTCRKGSDIYLSKSSISRVAYHPYYDGKPSCGFDIAICELSKQRESKGYEVGNFCPGFGSSGTVDNFQHWIDPNILSFGSTLEVAGYPGEKDSYPYMHRGQVKGVQAQAYGGYIVTYDVETSPGNSGSPIHVIQPNIVQQYAGYHSQLAEPGQKFQLEKQMFAVHTGCDAAANLNYGTLMTHDIQQWMAGVQDYMNSTSTNV